jgi:hypothetical protein
MVQTRSGLTTPEKAQQGADGGTTPKSRRSAGARKAREDGEDDGELKWHKGVAISMWQNSGDADSNWSSFIRSKFPFAALPFGFNRYSGKYSVDESCPDTWNR